jgi:PBP1b-binding outer membrane lipoprotein LpoB
VNKAERETIEEEMQYQESGAVSGVTAKKRGQQIGIDYQRGGALATNIQQVGNEKFIYYKLTMNLTNLETSTIDCTEEKQVRKFFKKRSVGL